MFDLSINPQVFKNWRHLLAFGFGSGLARKAPGTWGTLAAMPLCCALWWCLPWWVFVAALIVMSITGVMICDSVARDLGVHDHGGIVWDEWVGYGIALIALPAQWYWPLLAFALFRLFDIWKPWPISVCDKKIHGGFGIMVDDMLAGLLACVCLHALRIGAGL
ncbi:MAG TPA: phosphatidylglycerophosphatase A [Pseudomonadales bacterium]|nr:phosphatidylglycerophosphatase A [Pseudomonadales bacterium]